MYTDYTEENNENYYADDDKNNKFNNEKIKRIAFFVLVFVVAIILIILIAKACSRSGSGSSKNSKEAYLYLNQEILSLNVGDLDQIYANVSYSNEKNPYIEWVSDDSNIATVEDGVVTGVSEGETYITAVYREKDKEPQRKKCKVVVSSILPSLEQISFGQDEVTVKVGEELLMQVNATPENAKIGDLEFTSEDEKIAKVDNKGLITGVTDGYTIITAKEIKTGFTADLIVKVTVDGDTYATPTRITLFGLDDSLVVGKTAKVVKDVQPSNASNAKINWVSQNPSIATIDENGVVTAVSAGKCTIVATTENGLSDKIEIIVEANSIPVSSVNIVGSTSYLMLVGGTKKIEYTISPDNATNKNVSYSSTNSSILYIDSNGLISAVAPGVAVVTVTTEDGNKTAMVNVTVTAGSSGGTDGGSSSSDSGGSSGGTDGGSSSSDSGSSSSGGSSSGGSSSGGSSSGNQCDVTVAGTQSSCKTTDGCGRISSSSSGALSQVFKNASPAPGLTFTDVSSSIKNPRVTVYRGTTTSNMSIYSAINNQVLKVNYKITFPTGNKYYYKIVVTGDNCSSKTYWAYVDVSGSSSSGSGTTLNPNYTLTLKAGQLTYKNNNYICNISITKTGYTQTYRVAYSTVSSNDCINQLDTKTSYYSANSLEVGLGTNNNYRYVCFQAMGSTAKLLGKKYYCRLSKIGNSCNCYNL